MLAKGLIPRIELLKIKKKHPTTAKEKFLRDKKRLTNMLNFPK